MAASDGGRETVVCQHLLRQGDQFGGVGIALAAKAHDEGPGMIDEFACGAFALLSRSREA